MAFSEILFDACAAATPLGKNAQSDTEYIAYYFLSIYMLFLSFDGDLVFDFGATWTEFLYTP